MSSRLAAYVVVGVVALSSAAFTLVSVERAVVRISVQPKPVQVAAVELTGGGLGQRLATRLLSASAADSLTVASATRQLPATLAAGFVNFWCSPMTSCPNGYTVPAGAVLGSLSGARYVTEGLASFPSCQPSAMIAVRALTPGAGGNTGAGTVVYGPLPGYIHVTNSGPITGGADARVVPLVLQSNIDTASAALAAKVGADLNAELHVEAGALTNMPLGAPVFKVSSDAHAGDSAPSVTVRVTGTLQAVAFSEKGALALLGSVLAGRAPRGYQLTPASVTASYSLDPASGALSASATAYAVPEIDPPTMIAGMRGEGLSQAIAKLERVIPGSTVTIRTAPFASPWLPELADHISVVLATSPV